MGKGKGMFERRLIRLPKNTILFEFLGIPSYKLNFFIKKINKKLKFRTYLLKPTNSNDYNYKTSTKKNFVSNYFNKLLKFS